jgi:hypothetical protein
MTNDERQGKLELPDPPARKPDAAPPPPAATDITVTPGLLEAAEKGVASEIAEAAGGVPAAAPKRKRTPRALAEDAPKG